jgi:RND family efflux transporter MFP subunit
MMTNDQRNGKRYQFQPHPGAARPAATPPGVGARFIAPIASQVVPEGTIPGGHPASPPASGAANAPGQETATQMPPAQESAVGARFIAPEPPISQPGGSGLLTAPPYMTSPRAGMFVGRRGQQPLRGRGNNRAHWWKRRRLVVCCVVCLIVLAGGLVGLHLLLGGAPGVTLYRVSRQTVTQQAGGGGLTYPQQSLNISYPFTALILSISVQPGDKVALNQQLLQMNLSQVNAQYIAQLNGQVAQAYQDMLAAQSYLSSVSSTGNAVVIAQAQQQYAAAQANYERLRSEANASSLSQGNLLSPVSGVVVSVNVYPGQSIAANRVMLTIYDESSIVVHASLPLLDYGQIQMNQPAQIVLPALPSQNFQGRVSAIIPNANAQAGTFGVWVTIANIGGALLPGMDAFVRVQYPVQALVVPRLAVLNPDQGATVFVVRQQRVYIQPVQVAGYAGDTLLIGSGLQANDLVVLVGLDSLQNGESIRVMHIEGQTAQ